MKRIFIVIYSLVLLISCSNKSDNQVQYGEIAPETVYESADYAAPMAMAKRSMSENSVMQDNSSEQKIIKTANLRYEVFNMDSSLQLISETLVNFKGLVQNERQYDQGNRKYTSLTLRIPAENFHPFIDALMLSKDIRKLEDKSISAQDVTEQFVDIESRLATKKQALSRYREILQKAETVKDIMTVEDKIRYLQEEIEAQEARLKYLTHQVDMSEIRINIYQVVPVSYIPEKPESFGAKFLRSLDGGLEGIAYVFFWFIGFWPIWLLIIVLIVIIKRIRKKKVQQ